MRRIILPCLATSAIAADEARVFNALPSMACPSIAEALAKQNLKFNGTRWLSASAHPSTPIERAAAAIFERHAAGHSYQAAISGSEYWVQSHVEQKDADSSSAGIHLHTDFDMGTLEKTGQKLHPTFSTITYLTTSTSMPTIILTDFEKRGSVKDSIIHEMTIVYPKAGLHVVFNGSAWHGVAPPLVFSPGVVAAQSTARPGARRVTLLVNIWLDHIPGVQRGLPTGVDPSSEIQLPQLDLSEVADDHERRGWQQREDGSWIQPAAVSPSSVSPLALHEGSLALALMTDKAQCSGVKLWMPKGLLQPTAPAGPVPPPSAVAMSIVRFQQGGQRMEFDNNLCRHLPSSRHAQAGTHDQAGDGHEPPTSEALEQAAAAQTDFERAGALRTTDLKASMALLLRAAAAGHTEAQAVVGLAYAQGQAGLAADLATALSYLRRAASSGHTDAAYNLVALCGARPSCLEAVNTEQAVGWLQAAAAEGHAQAGFEAGVLLLRASGAEAATASFLLAARRGHAGAMFNAARLLHQTGDTTQAVAWFTKAAAQDDDHRAAADAKAALAVLLSKDEPGNAKAEL